MPGVAFVAHCLLNQNSKTKGGARCPGVYSPLVEELRAQGWQMQQMPCPELAFTGLNRFWAVREQLDTRAYRTHCRRLATAIAGAIELHIRRGDDVVLVGIEGSPSMGVHVTSSDPDRCGRPEWPEGASELSTGTGIFMEELEAELCDRGVQYPRAMGICHQLPSHDEPSMRRRLSALLEFGQVTEDARGFRVALVAGELLNPAGGGLDALPVLHELDWGVIQLPLAEYPDEVAEPLLDQAAEHAEEFAKYGYTLAVIGGHRGLEAALTRYGVLTPRSIDPTSADELRAFLTSLH